MSKSRPKAPQSAARRIAGLSPARTNLQVIMSCNLASFVIGISGNWSASCLPNQSRQSNRSVESKAHYTWAIRTSGWACWAAFVSSALLMVVLIAC